jgi:hypothetical protein
LPADPRRSALSARVAYALPLRFLFFPLTMAATFLFKISCRSRTRKVVGLIGALLWTDKLRLDDVLLTVQGGCPCLSYMAKRNEGSMTRIMQTACCPVAL